MGGTQVYEMVIDGRRHRVETSVGDGWSNTATWWVDDEEIATASSKVDDNLYLVADEEHELADEVGAVRARFTTLSKPVRATWFDGDCSTAEGKARLGVGGLDLVPEPGSPAAVREDRMRAKPRLYAARHVAAGVGKVVIPILLAALAARLVVSIPWPDWDLPSLPLPDLDLPSIPWPSIDLPSIPWPDWSAPGWLVWILDHLKYILPILAGLLFARAEISRRQHQDAERARRGAGGPSAQGSDRSGEDRSGEDRSAVRDVPAAEADDAEHSEGQPDDPGDDRPGDVDRLRRDVADEAEGGPLDQSRR